MGVDLNPADRCVDYGKIMVIFAFQMIWKIFLWWLWPQNDAGWGDHISKNPFSPQAIPIFNIDVAVSGLLSKVMRDYFPRKLELEMG